MSLLPPAAHARTQALIARARASAPVRCAVVHPCDAGSLQGALDAAAAGYIQPVLVANVLKLQAAAHAAGLDISQLEQVDAEHSHAAAEIAAQMAASGQVQMLMKGSLHTDELLGAMVKNPQLRTARRMSHVFRFEVPLYPKPLLITDAAINIEPDLAAKADIVQNAIDFARILGTDCPKVALLAAVETVNPKMPATLDAAALCKMADRGQITGALLDGPLAFDNAISPEAVRIKGIVSQVAGDADIVLAPDLESGNMLAKQLEYLGGAEGAGILLGARVPVALTSRADGAKARAMSALLCAVVAQHQQAQRLRP
ncbi:MAG: bifunctional enoyl-CoA hydratase/phosphate acetyltransferase [Brachymonas sp.]